MEFSNVPSCTKAYQAFSSFRELMTTWDYWLLKERFLNEENPSRKIDMLLDGQNLIMFFLKDKIVYGCPEESRMTFAKIKRPNKEDTDLDQARFAAINLYDALLGKTTENLFTKKDIKKIEIIEQNKCAKLLKKFLSKHKTSSETKVKNISHKQEDDRRPLRKEN